MIPASMLMDNSCTNSSAYIFIQIYLLPYNFETDPMNKTATACTQLYDLPAFNKCYSHPHWSYTTLSLDAPWRVDSMCPLKLFKKINEEHYFNKAELCPEH